MVMSLAFHTEESSGVGYTPNIFFFPNLSALTELEVALLNRKWDAILGDGTLTSFADTSLLMANQKVTPIAG